MVLSESAHSTEFFTKAFENFFGKHDSFKPEGFKMCGQYVSPNITETSATYYVIVGQFRTINMFCQTNTREEY